MNNQRKEFEKVAAKPPYERMCDRHGKGSAWEGQYKDVNTQFAWEMWQEAQRQLVMGIQSVNEQDKPELPKRISGSLKGIFRV